MLRRSQQFDSLCSSVGERLPLTLPGSRLSAVCVGKGGNYTQFEPVLLSHTGVIWKLIESRIF